MPARLSPGQRASCRYGARGQSRPCSTARRHRLHIPSSTRHARSGPRPPPHVASVLGEDLPVPACSADRQESPTHAITTHSAPLRSEHIDSSNDEGGRSDETMRSRCRVRVDDPHCEARYATLGEPHRVRLHGVGSTIAAEQVSCWGRAVPIRPPMCLLGRLMALRPPSLGALPSHWFSPRRGDLGRCRLVRSRVPVGSRDAPWRWDRVGS